MDLKIDVINKGPRKGDIVDQYIDFTKEVHDIIDEKGIANITADDVEALVKRCIRKGILAEFLTERLTEVTTLMHKIFNEDYYLKSIKSDGYAEGKRDERIAMAKSLLNAGVNLDIISKTTGFKPSYIQSLV